MGRPGQQSLNLWIPKEIHASIKKQALQNNISIKEYIIRLHERNLEESETQTIIPRTATDLEERLEKIEKQIASQSVKTVPRRTPKITKPKTQKPTTPIESIIEELNVVDIIPPGSTSGDLSHMVEVKDGIITLPDNIEQFLKELKLLNPRTRIKYYREILAAIFMGYHQRRSIEQYRGITFYGVQSKNCEKPLKNLVNCGLIDTRFINPAKPNQKSYFIANNFIS